MQQLSISPENTTQPEKNSNALPTSDESKERYQLHSYYKYVFQFNPVRGTGKSLFYGGTADSIYRACIMPDKKYTVAELNYEFGNTFSGELPCL